MCWWGGYAKRVILIYDHDVQNSQIINTLAIKYTPGRTPAHPMPSISARKRQFLGGGKSGSNWSAAAKKTGLPLTKNRKKS